MAVRAVSKYTESSCSLNVSAKCDEMATLASLSAAKALTRADATFGRLFLTQHFNFAA